MGQFFQQESFSDNDHRIFRERLQRQLKDLRSLLIEPRFSQQACTIGAELEMYLIGDTGKPAPCNTQLMDLIKHPQLQEELNRFNLEFNLSPVAAAGNPFQNMETELTQMLDCLHSSAQQLGAKVVPIGILPTLKNEHLQRQFMTDLPRYRALTRQLSDLKGEPFSVDINGQDSLKTTCDEVTLEGANTSFQVHLKVPSDRFAAMFNAAQLITPLVLALAGNSPTFLGKKLWQETRIALFKQSIDNRIRTLTQWRQPARVSFGQGWLREGAWELFSESVALYPPILPFLFDRQGAFDELCLHHGTVWSWNRAVFQPDPDAHLRIEYRTLPAGPTVVDMLANAALAIGWTVALADRIEDYLVKLPFQYAEYNFYRAAQQGLEAEILWPQPNQHQLTEMPAHQIIQSLLPLAAQGLAKIGVDNYEINRLIRVIEQRLETKQTGSRWQLNRLNKYLETHDNETALTLMLDDYIVNSREGHPVAQWQ
jgi:gamma-glutamyl:cysteine ligase YbdK (ATP-grasp superfamily)